MSPLSVARFTRRSLVIPLVLAGLAAPSMPHLSHAAPVNATVRTITITSAHVAFPKSIPAGMLALHLVTDAHSPLDAGLARIKPGASMAEIGAASASGDMVRLSRFVTFLGGVGVPLGSTGDAVLDLRSPGRYGLHITRGDQDPGQDFLFVVTRTGAPAALMPTADVSVTLQGIHIVGLPRVLHAGVASFKVTNRASSVRDLVFFRLDPGKTVQDMIVAARVDEQTHKDPSWAHDAGSVDILSPHQTTWATLHLTRGTYVALCPLPDPQKRDESLIFEGMINSFTVS